MTREEAEKLVSDLIYACERYDRYRDRYDRDEFYDMREAVVAALTTLSPAENKGAT